MGLKPIALDGKTWRGSHDRGNGKGALPLIGAWAVVNQLTLAPQAVGPASNEITAIPQLLQLLDLDGALVRTDSASFRLDGVLSANASPH